MIKFEIQNLSLTKLVSKYINFKCISNFSKVLHTTKDVVTADKLVNYLEIELEDYINSNRLSRQQSIEDK